MSGARWLRLTADSSSQARFRSKRGLGIANSDTKRNTPAFGWGDLGHNRFLTPAKK